MIGLFELPQRQAGRVEGICVRPARKQAVAILNEVFAKAGVGLEGDRYQNPGARQITLIQAEHLHTLGQFLGTGPVDFRLVRRNLVISGLNLLSLKGQRFRIGPVLAEYSGDCHPCTRMEEVLGPGGYHAMRGLGGITARILESGIIKRGDTLTIITL